MKKLLALCLALALLFSVSALAEETAVLTPADVVGTWIVTAYEIDGSTYSLTDPNDSTITIVVFEDGTGTITESAGGTTSPVTWEVSGSSLILDGSLLLTMKNGYLTYTNEENSSVMYFSNSGPAELVEDPWPDDLPLADPAGDAELDILGTWKLARLKMTGKYYTLEEAGITGMTTEFSADGTVNMDTDGNTGSGEWSREGTVITIHDDSGDFQFIIQNGNLIGELEGITMILIR